MASLEFQADAAMNQVATNTPSGGQSKRRKPDTDESPDKLSQLLDKPVDICGYCKKKCTAKCEALQCDLCAAWLHASCEGLTKDQYKLLNQLASSTHNIVYYCSYNHCLDRFKLLMSQSMQNDLTSKFDEIKTSLNQAISNLSHKIDQLQTSETETQNQIKDTKKALSSAYDPPSAHSSVADTIVQQLEDKNCRKNNILFFNIPESETSNSGVDPGFVSKLCKDVYNLDIQILKAFHLGKKLANKSRPLLVQLESEDIKARILAKSYLLKSTELYNNVYISADMTKTERIKHRQLVNELKSRWTRGESNIIIRNGRIVKTNRSQSFELTATKNMETSSGGSQENQSS